MGMGVAMEVESLGDWLRRIMVEKAPPGRRMLSERALAKAAGVSRGSIEKILDDPTNIPKIGTLSRLAAWAEVPVSDLERRVGIDPGDSRESADRRTARALALAARRPKFRDIIDRLLKLPPAKEDLVRAYLAYIEKLDAPAGENGTT